MVLVLKCKRRIKEMFVEEGSFGFGRREGNITRALVQSYWEGTMHEAQLP
jgi:hypothetical protein